MSASLRGLACAAVALASLAGCSESDESSNTPPPLTSCGHAHNDYEHPSPLEDALKANFCSIEADVFLEGGALLVAHQLSDTDPSRTLQSLYLDPLMTLVANEGAACSCDTLTLLVDVKSDAETTYAAIDAVLASYATMLTSYAADETAIGPVTVIISGNRARAAMEAQSLRYAAMDGRLSDLGTQAPLNLIPLISDNWNLHFSWGGVGEIPADARLELATTVDDVHAEGRRVRFWASPDTTASWAEQRQAGVDFINSDDLLGLAAYLNAATAP